VANLQVNLNTFVQKSAIV